MFSLSTLQNNRWPPFLFWKISTSLRSIFPGKAQLFWWCGDFGYVSELYLLFQMKWNFVHLSKTDCWIQWWCVVSATSIGNMWISYFFALSTGRDKQIQLFSTLHPVYSSSFIFLPIPDSYFIIFSEGTSRKLLFLSWIFLKIVFWRLEYIKMVKKL